MREKYEDLFPQTSDDLVNPPACKPGQEFEVTSVLSEERAESFGRRQHGEGMPSVTRR